MHQPEINEAVVLVTAERIGAPSAPKEPEQRRDAVVVAIRDGGRVDLQLGIADGGLLYRDVAHGFDPTRDELIYWELPEEVEQADREAQRPSDDVAELNGNEAALRQMLNDERAKNAELAAENERLKNSVQSGGDVVRQLQADRLDLSNRLDAANARIAELESKGVPPPQQESPPV